MKKLLTFALTLFLLLLTACSPQQSDLSRSENHSADIVYTMVTDEADGESKPCLSLDEDNKTFVFSYDLLSSRVNIGGYEIKDDVLTATTYDGDYTYLFKIEDDKTITFIQEGSSSVELTDEKIGVTITDGAKFSADE